jgi:WD40 repeat protein
MLYELLTGRPPFLAVSVEATLALVATEDPVPPRRLRPELPRDLETICLKCLAKDPSRRYAGAVDLADDLARFLGGEPIRARPTSVAERLVLWARRHREIAASLGLTLLLLLASSAGSLLAAAHFQRMEHAQRRLAVRNAELARASKAERRKAELARERARDSQRDAELTLADMHTAYGLQAADLGRDRQAVLWFASAAELAGSDPVRRWANLVRARAWTRRTAQPVAVFQHPAGVPLSLEFHPGGAYLLSSTAPYPGVTAVWDLATERPVPLSRTGGDVMATTTSTAAAWSGDGQWLASGGRDGVMITGFPDPADPERIPVEGAPTLLRFSPDGNRLAVAHGPSVRVWDRRRRAFLNGPLDHHALVLTLGFTPDGARLVSADEEGRFRVFALDSRRPDPELTGPHQQFGGRWTLHAPWVDPTGTRLVTVTAAAELTWWDLGARRRLESRPVEHGSICHVAPSPDGSLLAVTVENLGVAVVDAATRETVARLARGSGGMLFSAFRPDGRRLVVAGAHPEAQQWVLPEGAWLDMPSVEATGFRAAAFSGDGLRLATAGYESQIRVWALPQPERRGVAVPTFGAVGRGTFSADSQYLLARLRGDSARVFRTSDGSPVGPSLHPEGALVEAALAPDDRTAITAAAAPDGSGLVDFWNARSGCRRAPTFHASAPPITLGLAGNGRVAVLCRDGRLLLLDAPSCRVLGEWTCGATDQPAEDVGVTLSADGGSVLVSINGRLQLWDGSSGRLRFDPPRHPSLLYAALSSDGRLIASVGADSALRLWDAETGHPRGPALEHPSWVDGGVEFHPDSRHVLTVCKDMTIRVWDVVTGRLAAPAIQPASIGAARFTPDGRAVVSAGVDGTVEVWDWHSGRHLFPPRRLALANDWAFNGNRTLQISPDGRFVAVGGRPEVPVLHLDDLDATEEESSDDLIARSELIAHHRLHEGGTLVHLTGGEFLQLWTASRAAQRVDRSKTGFPSR